MNRPSRLNLFPNILKSMPRSPMAFLGLLEKALICRVDLPAHELVWKRFVVQPYRPPRASNVDVLAITFQLSTRRHRIDRPQDTRRHYPYSRLPHKSIYLSIPHRTLTTQSPICLKKTLIVSPETSSPRRIYARCRKASLKGLYTASSTPPDQTLHSFAMRSCDASKTHYPHPPSNHYIESTLLVILIVL